MQESFSKDKYAARLGVVHDGTRRLGGVDDGRKTSGGGGGSAGDETRQEIGVDDGDGKTINNFANTLLVVATLFASITFSAIFQPPGGLKEDDDGSDGGSAVLGKEAAFIVFVMSDAIALSTSLLSVFWLVLGMLGNHKRLRRVVVLNLNLLAVTLLTTMLAFITAVYSVTETASKALAISVLVIGCSTAIIFKWHFHPRRALMRRRGY